MFDDLIHRIIRLLSSANLFGVRCSAEAEWGGVIYLQRVYKPPLLVWQFGSLGSVAMITGPSESELGQLVIFLLIAF